MIKHSLLQGSDEWCAFRLEHDGASEAAAMLGLSKKVSRSELLRMKSTGIAKEFSAWVQENILDYGHEVEAIARPVIEAQMDDDLYPVTCSEGRMSASCDGLTLDGLSGWEHKQWNEKLAAAVAARELPDEYMVQPQQCMLVTGADRWTFTVSDGTEEKMVSMDIFPDAAWFERIRAGWEQFHKDKAEYVPPEVVPEVIAAPTKDLPTLSIQVNGSISLISNLNKFGAELNAFVTQIDKEPSDDQGFADAESAIKTLQNAQDALEAAEANALAQTLDIDDMRKTVKLYADTARTTRLMLEKMVKARKESIRVEIVSAAGIAFSAYVEQLERETHPLQLSVKRPDFAGAIKGKRTIASLRDAVDTTLANSKIEANAIAADIRAKLAWYEGAARPNAKLLNYGFLFADLQTIITSNGMEAFQAIVTRRIDDHKAAEAAKLEAQRIEMQAEEERKALAKVAAEEQQRINAQVKAQLEAQAAQLALERAETARIESEMFNEVAKIDECDAKAIEETRKRVQCAEQERPGKVVQFKATRPSDKEIIANLAANFGVTTDTACNWILEIAENLRSAA